MTACPPHPLYTYVPLIEFESPPCRVLVFIVLGVCFPRDAVLGLVYVLYALVSLSMHQASADDASCTPAKMDDHRFHMYLVSWTIIVCAFVTPMIEDRPSP